MNGPPEPVFWVDENLGSAQFISRLRLAGLQVRANVFPEGTKDVVWIPQIAEYGWVAITDEAFLGKIYVKGGETAVVSLTDLCSRSNRRWGRK